jgi:hypothetical protein
MTTRNNEAREVEHDLLTDRQAQRQDLPMSLAWYRRKRLFGGGSPFIRVSNRVFYRRGELRRWIAEKAIDLGGRAAQ